MKIIALCGQKQSGKSSSVEYIRTLCRGPFFVYSFAEKLKKFCIDTLGLTREQCDGTDEQKNSLTLYLWENVDQYFIDKYSCESAYMTARQVMQVQGEMQRRFFYKNIWVDSLFRDIISTDQYYTKEGVPPISIVSDVRHLNEVECCHRIGALIIHLAKKTNSDQADSEKELLSIDWNKYNAYTIDNTNMTIEEKNIELQKIIRSSNLFNDYLI